METAAASSLRLQGRTVDLSRGTVTNGSGPAVTLRAQALAVFKMLAAKPGELVSKDELMAAVWPNIAVTDDSLVQCIAEIRKALGDDDHTIIKTVPKRGYVFEPGPHVAARPKMRAGMVAGGLAILAVLAAVFWFAKPAPAPGDVPSIAVLPFDDMSGNKSLAYLGDGVAEDIITMLARSPDVRVTARNSSFTYKDKPVDVRKVGAELGVDYVVEGSVRKEGDKLRIVAQLNDAKSGEHLWAERFDKTGTDPWALQDEVTGKIIGALTGEFGQLKLADYRKVWGRDTTNFGVYDYYLRAHQLHMNAESREDLDRAGAILKEGLDKYPDSALLQVKYGSYWFKRGWHGWSEDLKADFRRAGEFARLAAHHDKLTPLEARLSHWVLAFVLSQERDFTRALKEANAALAIAPYDTWMAADLGAIFVMAGNPLKAIELYDASLAVDPTMMGWHSYKGWAFQVAGKPEQSLAEYKKLPLNAADLLFEAISLVRVGRLDDAKANVRKAIAKDSSFTQTMWRDFSFYADPSIAEHEIADLAKAGLPEK